MNDGGFQAILEKPIKFRRGEGGAERGEGLYDSVGKFCLDN